MRYIWVGIGIRFLQNLPNTYLVNPGTETQINLKPTISYTSDDLLSTFSPQERNCYVDREANLTYLPFEDGYRYEMDNCLIDEGIRDVIWNCRCWPSIWRPSDFKKFEAYRVLPYCAGGRTKNITFKNGR